MINVSTEKNDSKSSWANIVRDLGFPIVVALILLYQLMQLLPLVQSMDRSLLTIVSQHEAQQRMLDRLEDRLRLLFPIEKR